MQTEQDTVKARIVWVIKSVMVMCKTFIQTANPIQ